ncbi:MAG: RNA polymerase sigma factor [Kiritimatiellae bacterium]|nr:RNA polymerase sigma factor [Kiritimatiellia bacterium]
MHSLEIYEILVSEHEKMLQAYVLGIVKDPVLAEEIVQETFVRAYEKLPSLRKKAAFGSWVRTIARNLAYAEFARRGRELTTDPEIMEGMEDVFGELDQPELGDVWEDRVQAARHCFEDLPDKLRDCCRLFYFEDRSTRECADTLQTSLAAVLKRLERARTAIARCIEKRLKLEAV